MNNFGTLYRYECKKLLSKKIVWISFVICMAIIILSELIPFFGDYYIDGERVGTNYNMYQIDRNYARALSGREIDQGLIEETLAAYRRIPETFGRHYTSTEEYQRYARPYSEIFNFLRTSTGMPAEVLLSWQPDPTEEDLDAMRQIYLKSLWRDLRLSEGEMSFWQEQEAQIKKPYVYQAQGGYSVMLTSYQTVGIFALIFFTICLSGMFSDEHTRKTDQIILSSPLGKTGLYWVKMAVGVSFAVISTTLFFFTIYAMTMCLRGAEGFQAAFQLIYPTSSDPITCGQAVFIAYGNLIVTVVLVSVIVMVLSELLHSSIAVLAVSTALLFLTMIFSVPERHRVLAQIWEWFPWGYPAPWNVFGKYTISILGHYLTSWQAVPLIYSLLSVMIGAAGRPVYRRFQVSGR